MKILLLWLKTKKQTQNLKLYYQIRALLTFRLPQQEQGVSILQSSSSSWHILHSTIFLGEESSLESTFWEDITIFVSFAVDAVACIKRFLLSIAASNVDSVSNRSTNKTKWSPISKFTENQGLIWLSPIRIPINQSQRPSLCSSVKHLKTKTHYTWKQKQGTVECKHYKEGLRLLWKKLKLQRIYLNRNCTNG